MSSHRQIFKSTALVGSTQVINMGINIVRTKVLAMLLGPAGTGLAGLYVTATNLIGSVAGLGINASGVRQIAEAASTSDEVRLARTVVTLRRASLISGVLGMILVVALAPVLSLSTFGDKQHVLGISLMSFTLVLSSISASQGALLQGLRKLRELAASQVLGAVFGAAVSIALVWWLREHGIVPFLVTIYAFGTLLSWWYARKVPVEPVDVSWRETLSESRTLLRMGLAFTCSGLISSGVAYLTRVLVQRQLGVEAVGIYTATWTLSSYYVGLVLGAMGADLMPRLTAVAQDHAALNRLVNEQTEMGVLIAVPGVLATLTLAPWVMKAFYSGAFVIGADVVRWQILGVLLRVVSSPMGYVLIAKGRSVLYAITELAAGIASIALILPCMRLWELKGVGIYFLLLNVLYTAFMAMIIGRLTGFRWSVAALKILGPALLLLGIAFVGVYFLPRTWSLLLGLLLTTVSGAASLQMLQNLLGVNLLERILAKFGLKDRYKLNS
jgi:PST family polysaccharide transporter